MHGKRAPCARLPVGQKVINQFPDPTTAALISPSTANVGGANGGPAPPPRHTGVAGLRHDGAGVAYRSRAHDRDGGDWRSALLSIVRGRSCAQGLPRKCAAQCM